MGFVEEMTSRGLVAQITHEEEFRRHCANGQQTAYVGFDPTAASLHVGHLIPVMTLARWQKAGHRVIALMGGGTALVGDPTGKTDMRKMLSEQEIDHNIAMFKKQVAPLLDFSDPSRGVIVNNADWLKPLNYLGFLRDIGVHFSVNRMLTAECFKARMEKGLSFLEFNYMLLQAYDFLHLYQEQGCAVQLGGDDQWSNILAGADLIRRKTGKQAYCLTVPLLTTSDGRKMGKTEEGAIWIDPERTSPYEYFQFWRNVTDDLVGKCLRLYTFLPLSEVERLEALEGSKINVAKKTLAYECTKILHGQAAAEASQVAAEELFGAGPKTAGSEPVAQLPANMFAGGASPSVGDVLINSGFFTTKSEVRRLVSQGGLAINGKKVDDINQVLTSDDFAGEQGCLVRKGKKHYYRLKI